MNVFDKDKTLLLWTPQMGLVVRQDGVLKYISKGVDASQELVDGEYEWRENHLDQPTASQQPRLVGGIAPNSKVAASNQNGEARYFTHTPISFGVGDAWSVTFMINWDGTNSDLSSIIGIKSTLSLGIHNKNLTSYKWQFREYDSPYNFKVFNASNSLTGIGKKEVITLIAEGNGFLNLYRNGIFIERIACVTKADFQRIIQGYTTSGFSLNGSWLCYHIQSGALTPTQVTSEYNLLRSMYPEIESVDIGTKTWATRNFEAVATPEGNVISEMQDNAAVENALNGINLIDSNSDGLADGFTLFLNKGTPSIVTGNGFTGKAQRIDYNTATAGASAIAVSISPALGWYKVKFEYRCSKNSSFGTTHSPWKSYPTNTGDAQLIEGYFYKNDTSSSFVFTQWLDGEGQWAEFGNISIQKLGWSNATEIYDAVYAETAGTAATKEYAALKEAAMWRYPSNSIDKGAWGGKLYNKYAMMLLSLDMASADFGYHIPTNAEVVELLAQVGGDTNKLKYVGLDYWNDAIGTNESGLTLLGTGVITPGGVYTGEKELTGFWTSDSNEFPTSGLPIRIVKNV